MEKKSILVLLLLDIIFSVSFLITGFVVTDKCLVDSVTCQGASSAINTCEQTTQCTTNGGSWVQTNTCVLGGGTEEAYSVTPAQSFGTIIFGILFLAEASFGIYLLNKGTSAMNVGMLLAACVCSTVIALAIAVEWGAKVHELSELDLTYCLVGGGGAPEWFQENKGDQTSFAAVTAFAALLFIVKCLRSVLLGRWKEMFVVDTHDGVPGSYDRLNDQGGLYAAPPTADL